MITKLTEIWKAEQKAFAARDLSGADYVYLWADGTHVNIRLEEYKLCLLVMIGGRADGRKELIALANGYRESAELWADCATARAAACARPGACGRRRRTGVLGCAARGLPSDTEQRCWFHKTANVLAALPKSAHPAAKKGPGRDLGRRGQAPRPGRGEGVRCRLRRSSPRPPRKSPMTWTSCSRSTTIPPSTGCICARPTRSSRPLPRSGTGPSCQGPRLAGRRAGHGIQAHRVSPGPLALGQRTTSRRPVCAGAAFINGKLADDPARKPSPQLPKRSSSTGLLTVAQ